MAIFKCKMCGGTLEINNNESVGTCEYCGTQQTVPKTDDEVITNLFNRANNLRLKCEFDKAAQIYEKIIQQDDSQAEAHWGLVLCKYGIEYVEDPKTFKRIPTCHRTSFDAVTTDVDYQAAIDYSDTMQQSIYEAEARAIDRIQKDILVIVKNEKPFDVFLCYKETDADGKRTIDSTIANDIYYQLTQEGFKVFYAAITLEDKLGQEYEPYIFAALNSAKVMLVLGTKPEYFTAVWVKNVWSRFMNLMKTDRSKLLIPCYRDMDAYDLPEEFAHLQSQDMSKIGFINDVVRGIRKVITTDEPKQTVVQKTVVTNTNLNIAPLLKRAFMFLEDKDWNSADEYCEKVLDIDPECAEAYLGKLMVELNITSRQNLKNCSTPFDNRNNFQKSMRFADDNLKNELQGYIDFIINRNLTTAYNDAVHAMKSAMNESDYKKAAAKFEKLNDFRDSKQLVKVCYEKAEESRLTVLYDAALMAMNTSETEQQYKTAAEKFNVITNFRDSKEKAKHCWEEAEKSRKDAIYFSAVSSMDEATIPSLKKAIEQFKIIEEWKDSSNKIYDCERNIENIEQREEADRIEAARLAKEKRLEAERIAEEERIAAEKAAKKRKTIIAIITPIVCASIAFIIVLNTIIIPNGKYNDAIQLMEDEKFEDAVKLFAEISDYKDADEKRKEALYLYAIDYQDNEQYENAIITFEKIKGYKDSSDRISVCQTAILDNKYNAALALMNEGKYENAITAFEEIKNHKDSSTKISACMLALAQNFVSIGDTTNAIKWYEKMGDTNSANKVRYDYVLANRNSTNTTTYEYLKTLKTANYNDSSSIYASLYKVTGKVFFNADKKDTNTSLTTYHDTRENGDAYCHYQVFGGTPSAEIKVKIVYETRWGTDNSPREPYKVDTEATYTVKPGEDNIFWRFNLASNLYYHRVTLYNAETGEQLSQATLYSLYLW